MTGRRELVFAVGAGSLVLLVAGVGAAGAVVASRMLSPGGESKAVIDDAAAQLGIEPSALSEALERALENRIDEAVEQGLLTEEQAERLREHRGSGDDTLLFGMGPWHRHGPGGGRPGSFGLLEAAAAYLGMTEEELRGELRDRTLAEIAKDRHKAVTGLVDELVAVQTRRIDEAVDADRLTGEQADRLKAGLRARTQALVDGDFQKPFEGRHRFWPGSGSPRAPPLFGPSA